MTLAPPSARPVEAPGWMRWLTRIALAIGAIAFVATIWVVGPSTIVGHLRAIGWLFVLLVAIEILSSVCDGIALYYMAHGPGHPSLRQTIVAQLAGRGVNSVTPGGNLGEALKVGLLSRQCSPRRIVAAVMYTVLIAVAMSFGVIAIGTAATAFWFDVPRAGMIALLATAAAAAGAAIGIVLLVRRGMMAALSKLLSRARIISRDRRERWMRTLSEIDARMRGQNDGDHRRKAIALIAVSQLLQKGPTYLTVLAAGYELSGGQFLALLSAGVLLGWLSTVVPLGLGISESGNVALFSLIGAPPALGVALALARRVNQVVFASIGFVVLTADRVASRLHGLSTSPT